MSSSVHPSPQPTMPSKRAATLRQAAVTFMRDLASTSAAAAQAGGGAGSDAASIQHFSPYVTAAVATTVHDRRARWRCHRRWRVAIAATRFALRIRHAAKARLSVGEQDAALALYIESSCEEGGLDNKTKIRAALFNAGQLVDEDELYDLCNRVGYDGGSLPFDKFRGMLEVRKRAYHEAQQITDTEAAFRSLMDPETEDISTDRLLALCRDFCLSAEVEQLITDTDADGSGKIELDEFTVLLEKDADEDLSAAAVNQHQQPSGDDENYNMAASVMRATELRRKMKQEDHRRYEALRRRVANGAFAASMRGAPHTRLDSTAGLASFNTTSAHGGGGGGARDPAASSSIGGASVRKAAGTSPPKALVPLVATAATDEAQHSSRSRAAGEQHHRPLSPQVTTTAGREFHRVGTFLIVQVPSHKLHGASADVQSVPPPVPRAIFKPSKPETLNGSAARLLTPRRPNVGDEPEVELSAVAAFGTSSGRFHHEALLPLKPPSHKRPVSNRPHPSDHCSVYRRYRRVDDAALDRTTSCRGSRSPPSQPLSPTAVQPTPLQHACPPSRAPRQPVAEYAQFNPFLALPPPRRTTTSARGASSSARGSTRGSATKD